MTFYDDLKTNILKEGSEVIATDASEYAGLKGVITEIRQEEEKETENESEFDIYIDFEEPREGEYLALNGTSVKQVVMGEDELGYFIGGIPFDVYGRIVCPSCFKPIKKIIERQFDDIEWIFENGEYQKNNSFIGDTDGKRCDDCRTEIPYSLTDEVVFY